MAISSLMIIVTFLMMLLIIILLVVLLRRINNEVPDESNDYARLYSELKNELAEIYKGIGKMEVLASGVDDLKRLLSNVKTRGIIGENQLDAIFKEILTKDQYESQFALVESSRERVDFAIKFPGGDDEPVYLPVDSKFPGDLYHKLVDAMMGGNKKDIEESP